MSHPPAKPRKRGVLDKQQTGQLTPPPAADGKNRAAQLLGQIGGIRRAQTMSPERRSEIARAAAKSRWDKGSGR